MLNAASAPHTNGLAWYKGGASCDFILHLVFFLVFLGTVQSVKIRSIPPGQKWPGFSFALHLLMVQGFYFALLQYSQIQAFTACFALSMQLYRPRRKTAHGALQGLLLRLHQFTRPRYQTDTNGYNSTCDTLEGIHAPGRAQHIPDTTATPERCTGQHRPPIIIRYIRGQPMPARRVSSYHVRIVGKR